MLLGDLEILYGTYVLEQYIQCINHPGIKGYCLLARLFSVSYVISCFGHLNISRSEKKESCDCNFILSFFPHDMVEVWILYSVMISVH